MGLCFQMESGDCELFEWEKRGMVVVFGFICVVATAILPLSPPKQMVINFSKGSLKHHPAM